MDLDNLSVRQQTLHKKIETLVEKLPEESATRKQLSNHQELFDDAVNYLSNRSNQLAFIGNIGAGKTTSICHLLGLLDDKNPILSTGSGRTTLCEVEIVQGLQLEIDVTPHSEEEVRSYLLDFAQYLCPTEANETQDNMESFKLSAEVERALRNMLNLRSSRAKSPEGKWITTDKAKNFAADFSSVGSLASELLIRIGFDKRNQTLFSNEHGASTNEWLHTTFKAINSCTLPKVGLAKHIRISIPNNLFENIDFKLSVLDTKGVDQTVNRPDLDKCQTNDRTVSVLCSRFNDAPDKTMSDLLKLAKNAGLSQRTADETVLLILDREGEAENIIDFDEAIGDKSEGREIRSEQIRSDLLNALQLADLDVQFLDANTDDPKKLKDFLVRKVSALREKRSQDLSDTESAVNDIENELFSQSAKAAKAQVKETLRPWIKKAQSCSPNLKEYFLPLINDIEHKGTYAASVRASVNRKGEWHNLNYYQLLASGAREQVVEQVGQLKDELLVLINNMLSQNELQPAYALLKQIKQTAEKRLGDIYQESFAKGRAVYQEQLSSDSILWHEMAIQWGMGPGYKDRIANRSSHWFQNLKYPEFENQVTKQAAEAWGRFVTEADELLGSK